MFATFVILQSQKKTGGVRKINPFIALAIVQTVSTKEQFETLFASSETFLCKVLVCGKDDYLRHIAKYGSNYSVIIACNSALKPLASVTSVPVVPLTVSFQDILRSILMSRSYNSETAFVGNEEECSQASTICQLLQIDMPIVPVDRAGLDLELEKLRASGCSIVVGNESVTAAATELGLGNIPVTISAATAAAAIKQARALAEAVGAEKKQLSLIQNALSASDFLIVILDESGEILFSSANSPDYAPVFELIRSQPISKFPKKQMVKLGANYWNMEKHSLYLPFCSAVCLYIQKQHYDLEDIAMRGIMIATHSDLTKHGISESFLSSCASTHDIVEEARNYAKLPSPTIIFGEPGVGKNSFANIIHKYSYYKENHVIVVDCELVELPTWAKLLHEPDSILMETDVVYFFKNFEQIPAQVHNSLLQYLRQMNGIGQSKFVFSCNCSGTVLPDIPLVSYLVENLRASWIYVPPLRARLDELSSLCSVFISSLSVELNSQVIGLEPNAAQLLREYSWPGNLNQLRRFIAELIASSKGYYITAKTVSTELKREAAENASVSDTAHTALDLSGSLEEIEKRILLQVLNEEGQNQTNAAKRLGISRSTFWRKLRS